MESRHPCALAIAGLDPSGGAGVFADLRAFAVANVWGCGVVTVLTAQTTAGLVSAHPVDSSLLLRQIRGLASHQNIRSIKIGALGSASNARAITGWLDAAPRGVPVVFDPVTGATSGPKRASLGPSSKSVLLAVARRATVFTPNVPEAEMLVGAPIVSVEGAERAARELVRLGCRAALVKGGHLPVKTSGQPMVDVLAIGERVLLLKTRRIRSVVHGTGCTLASLIAGRLARVASVDDRAIIGAVRWAKQKLTRALAHPRAIGDGALVIHP